MFFYESFVSFVSKTPRIIHGRVWRELSECGWKMWVCWKALECGECAVWVWTVPYLGNAPRSRNHFSNHCRGVSGGPYKRTPKQTKDRVWIAQCSNIIFFQAFCKQVSSSGNWIVSKTSDLTWAKPPTSSHMTLGIFGNKNLWLFPVRHKNQERNDISSFKVLRPLNELLQIDSYAVFIVQSMDAALARATRSDKSPASRAAVWITRRWSETYEARRMFESKHPRISRRSPSLGA